MSRAIWWVRRDLRLTDNRALAGAMAAAAEVIPLFILDPSLLDSRWVGEKRTAFLYGALHSLDEDLRGRESRLHIYKGKPIELLKKLCEKWDVASVHAERDYSPYATKRDDAIAEVLDLQRYEGVLIRPLGSVFKDDGDPYTVFTPYSRRWMDEPVIQRSDIVEMPKTINTPADLESDDLPDMPALLDDLPFTPSETAGKQRLGMFVKDTDAPVYEYDDKRDLPFEDATSQLSPYLRMGLISPRLAALGAYNAMEKTSSQEKRKNAATWLSELIWRDFYYTIMAEFPHVRQGAFRPKYDDITWDNDEELFQAWCDGQTGYPFVDAAMRQLSTIGWMHNRARMVVASFLVKDLLIDWRWGEQWFMQQLVDGDPASNNGGWQWTAGTGTDAAPYFRIFNPISQSEKFDPDGEYIRKWVPELAKVPTKSLHAPWKLSKADQKRANCLIGEDYPKPIIDHKWARERTLDAYKAIG